MQKVSGLYIDGLKIMFSQYIAEKWDLCNLISDLLTTKTIIPSDISQTNDEKKASLLQPVINVRSTGGNWQNNLAQLLKSQPLEAKLQL